MLWFRKTEMPSDNTTKSVEVVQLWEVEWTSRHGEFSSSVRQEWEIFTKESDAMHFRDAIENAYKLIRHTHGNSVKIRKRG